MNHCLIRNSGASIQPVVAKGRPRQWCVWAVLTVISLAFLGIPQGSQGATLSVESTYLEGHNTDTTNTIEVARNNTAFLGGPLIGSGGLTLQGGFGPTLPSALSLINILGNTFSGNLTVDTDGGTLRLGGNIYTTNALLMPGAVLSNMTSASTITVRPGGRLEIEDNASASAAGYVGNRFGTDGNRPNLRLENGAFNYNGANASSLMMTQTLGSVSLGRSISSINVIKNQALSTPKLIFTNTLSADLGGTVNLYGSSLGTAISGVPQIIFTNPPPSLGGILPAYVRVNNADWASNSILGYGITALPAYTNTLVGGSANDNVKAVAGVAITFTGNTTINSLNVGYATNLYLGANSLTLQSGGFLNNAGSMITGTAGYVTAGLGNSVLTPLYVYPNANLIWAATVRDNPAGSGNAVAFVQTGVGTVSFAQTNDLNNYSGGTYVSCTGTLATAGTANRRFLGTGPVVVDNAGLSLGNIGATANATDPDYAIYNAGWVLIPNVAFTANDTFYIGPRSIVQQSTVVAVSNGFGLNSLDRGLIGGGSANSNITLATDAIIGQPALLAPFGSATGTIKNLGTAADLYYGLAAAQNSTSGVLTIGSGTPFKGISTLRAAASWNLGTLDVGAGTSDIYLQGLAVPGVIPYILTIGNTPPTLFGPVIRLAGAGTVNANVLGQVILDDDASVFGDTSAGKQVNFVVTPGATLQLNSINAMGSGSGIASATVQRGGTLQMTGHPGGLSGNTEIQRGGRLLANNAGGLTGGGQLTVDSGAIVQIANASGFIGPQATTATFEPGAIVRINVANVGTPSVSLDSLLTGDSPIYQIYGGVYWPVAPAVADTTIMTLNRSASGLGGMLVNDLTSRLIVVVPNGKIVIGPNGGVIAAAATTTLTIPQRIEQGGNELIIGSSSSVDGTVPLLGQVTLTAAAGYNTATNGSRITVVPGATLGVGSADVLPDAADVVQNGVLTLAASEVIGSLSGTGRVDLAANTLTIGRNNVSTNFSGQFVGTSGGIIKSGTGRQDLTGAISVWTGAGTVKVTDGILALSGNGTLPVSNTTAFTLIGNGTLLLDNSVVNNINRLSTTTPAPGITFQGGKFKFIGMDGAASSESLGVATLNSGASTVEIINGNGAGSSVDVTFSGLTPSLGTLNFIGTGGTLGTNGDNLRAKFTAGVTAGTVLSNITVNGSPAFYDATYGLRAMVASDGQEFNGAAVQTTINTVFTPANVNNTLTLPRTVNSLWINSPGVGKFISLGNGIGTSNLTVNGRLTLTGDNDFEIVRGAASSGALAQGSTNLYINTAAGRTLTVSVPISGSGTFAKDGPGVLALNSNNTFTGTLTINEGTVRYGATGDLAATMPLTIWNAGQLDFYGTNDTIGAVTIYSGGITNSQPNGTLAVASLTMGSGPGGSIAYVNSGSGKLTLTTAGVTYNNANDPGMSVIDGNLNLGIATRTFTVANSTIPEAFIDLDVPAKITGNAGVGITKAGTGAMRMGGANTFDGPLSITGTLIANHPQAPGAPTVARTITVAGSSSLVFDGSKGDITVSNNYSSLSLSGSGNTLYGPVSGALINQSGTNTVTATNITLAAATTLASLGGKLSITSTVTSANLALTVDGAGDTELSGVLAMGTAGLTKNGAGTLTLSGSVSNAFSGATTLSGGKILLAKSGPTASAISNGAITVSSGGVLQYAPASANTNLIFNANIALNGTGQLDFNGSTDTVGTLTIASGTGATGDSIPLTNSTAGGTLTLGGLLSITPLSGFTTTLETGSGALKLGGDITAIVSGSGKTALRGNLDLGAATLRTFTVPWGSVFNAIDLDVPAVVTGAVGTAIIKVGTGEMRLSGANTFDGNVTVSAGILSLSHPQALGTPSASIGRSNTVANSASLVLNNVGTFVNPASNLYLNGAGNTTLLLPDTGALVNRAGNNTVPSPLVTLSTPSTIASLTPGDKLTMTGTITSVNQALTITGRGDIDLNGPLALGTGGLTKNGNGTLRLLATNSVAGTLTINSGRVVVVTSGRLDCGGMTLANSAGIPDFNLVVTNGGRIYSSRGPAGLALATIGSTASSNRVLVTGTGSLWDNANSNLTIGTAPYTNNLLRIDQGGAVTNVGTLTLNPTNDIELLGGTLTVSNFVCSKTTVFTIGDGFQSATFGVLGGNATATNGIMVSSNAVLMGRGVVNGGLPTSGSGVTLANGAVIAPVTNGVGTLTVAGTNLIWNGGARYVCDVTNLYAGPGAGWDLLNVSNRLVLLPGNTSCVISVESQGQMPTGAVDGLDFNLLVMTVKTGTDLDLSMISLRTNDFVGAQYGNWGMTNIGTNLYLTYRSTAPVVGSLYTWDAPSNGCWSVGTNWLNRTAPVSYSPSMQLQFGTNATTAGYTASNNFAGQQYFMLNRLVMSNANAGVTNYLNGNGIEFWKDNARLEQGGASPMIISNAVNLKTDLTLGGNGSGTGTLVGVITGTGSFTKVGTSAMMLSVSSNSFIGDVTVGGGLLRMDHVGSLNYNSIQVTNGTFLNTATITFGASPYRTARVTGSGSIWSNTPALTVGSNGLITVTDGGRMACAALTVVNEGTPNTGLNVTNGGQLVSTWGAAIIGNAKSNCQMTIWAGGSTWNMNTQALTIGTGGGTGNVLTVDGSFGGALVTNAGIITVGSAAWSALNQMRIINGGRVYSQGASLIGNTSSNNTVLVTGTGSLWDNTMSNLTIGAGGGLTNNVLRIDQGGSVLNVGTLTLYPTNDIVLLGGTLTVSNLTSYQTNVFTIGDGYQAATFGVLLNGNATTTNGIMVSSNAFLVGRGVVSGGLPTSGSGVTLANGATLAPGTNGAGTLTIGGTNLIWNGGATYECDVTNLYAGPGAGWDLLNVASRLVLLPGNTSCVISVESQGQMPTGAVDGLDFNLLVMTVKTGTDLDLSMISLRTNDFVGAQYGNWGITNIGTNLYLTYRSTASVGGSLYTWAAPNYGYWTNGMNWTNTTAPVSYSPSMLLQFGVGDSTLGYSTTNNYLGNFMLNRLTLNNANAGVSNVLNGNTIEFWNTNALLEQVGASSMIISNPVNLKTDLTLGGNGSTGILAGVITGTGSITKVGTSTMILSVTSNSFIGDVTVGGGLLRMDQVGSLNYNSIQVTNGTLLNAATITFGASPYRTARVTGSGIWSNTPALTVGSNGLITVADGGRMALAALTVVNEGTPNTGLNVTNGGQLVSTWGAAIIGNAKSNCQVTIWAGGSTWNMNTQSLTIGTGGGTGNVLTVDGSAGGALVTNAGVITVGTAAWSAFNQMRIINGGRIYSQSVSPSLIGNASSNNTVQVLGTGSVWDNTMSNLTIGAGGGLTNNVLRIDQGGSVLNVGTLILYPTNDIVLLGGMLTVSNLTRYQTTEFTIGDGDQSATFGVLGGTAAATNGIMVSSNAFLVGRGVVSGGLPTSGSGVTLTNGATLAPGINGAGTLTIGGTNLIWYGGATYECDVTNLYAGPGAGWDLLNVSNRLVLLPGNTACVISVESQGNIPVGATDGLDFNLLVMTVKTGTDLDLSMVSLRTNDFVGAQYGDWGITNIGTNLYLTYRSTDPVGTLTATWNAPSNGNWSVSTNWISQSVPISYSPSMWLEFGGAPAGLQYNSTNNYVGNFMLNRLTLTNDNNTVTPSLWGYPLEFWNANARLEMGGAGPFVISNTVNLKTDLTLGGIGLGTGTLAGVIVGTGSITKVGTSAIILSSVPSNTFIGGVTVGGGLLRMDHVGSLNYNSIQVTNGTLWNTATITFGASPYRTALVTGSGSIWSNSLAFTLGTNGLITVTDGGQFACGALTIAYAGIMPNTGFIVTNGGKVYSKGNSTIGNATSNNTVLIPGPNTLWDNAGYNLTIGAATWTNNMLRIDQTGSVLNVGTLTVNPSSDVVLVGGTLTAAALTSTKGTRLTLGDGAQAVNVGMLGGTWTNSAGILVQSNATVSGGVRLTAGNSGLVFTNGSTLIPGFNTNTTLYLGNNPTWYGGMSLELNVTNVAQASGIGWDCVRVIGTLNFVPAGKKLTIKLDSLGETVGGFDPNTSRVVTLVTFASAPALTTNNIDLDTTKFLLPGTWFLEKTDTDLRYVYRRTSSNLYVSTLGNDTAGTNWTTAFTTLTNALAFAQNYDTIYLKGQTFNLNTQAVLQGRTDISILGGYEGTDDANLPGPCNPAQWKTKLKNNAGQNRVLNFSGLTNCTLRGVWIMDGGNNAFDVFLTWFGLGMRLTASPRFVIDNCVFTNNTGYFGAGSLPTTGCGGGGLYIDNSSVLITNSIFTDNMAGSYPNQWSGGGGLMVDNGSSLDMVLCKVVNNKLQANNGFPYFAGAGIYLAANTTNTIRKTVISKNTELSNNMETDFRSGGGGIQNWGQLRLENCIVAQNNFNNMHNGDGILTSGSVARLSIVNCTIADNGTGPSKAGSGVGIGIEYPQGPNGGTIGITNSIIWGHDDDLKGLPNDGMGVVSNLYYCNIGNGDLGILTPGSIQSCFSIDPKFIDTTYYHLKSKNGSYVDGYFDNGTWQNASLNSESLDAGDPNSDYSNEPDPNGGLINLGSYGNTDVADKMPATTADPAVVTNRGATAWGYQRVYLNGEILSPGGETPDVGFMYWLVDDNSVTTTVAIGMETGIFNTAVGDVLPGNDYQFVAFATNIGGLVLSDVQGFSTRSLTGALYVSANGNNTAGTNWTTAYTAPQDAMSIAQTGDSILLAGQTFVADPVSLSAVLPVWTLQGKENITVIGGYQAANDSDLPGPNDPAQWPTKLSRDTSTRARILLLNGLTNCTIQGIQVLNGLINMSGNQTEEFGAGIFIDNSMNLTLNNCIISNNAVNAFFSRGGGLYVTNSWLLLTNCLITSCQASNINYGGTARPAIGGGMCLLSGSITIVDSMIRKCFVGNITNGGSYGGGIFVTNNATLVMRRSVLQSNRADQSTTNDYSYGDGLYCASSNAWLENCLIEQNGDDISSRTNRYGGGIHAAGKNGSTLTITNCTIANNDFNGIWKSELALGRVNIENSILWGNGSDDLNFTMTAKYCDIGTADTFWTNGVDGCMSLDPLFVDTTYYHLQSQRGYYVGGYFSGGSGWSTSLNDSPCIDAGNLNSDFSLEPSPNGSRVNLGAYANTTVASKTIIAKGTIFKSY